MNSQVDLWIEQHSEDMIKDLQKLVSFKSVSHAELATARVHGQAPSF